MIIECQLKCLQPIAFLVEKPSESVVTPNFIVNDRYNHTIYYNPLQSVMHVLTLLDGKETVIYSKGGSSPEF